MYFMSRIRYIDGAEHLLRMALPAASTTQPHLITAYLNLTSPPPYEARINGGGRPYLDRGGAMWVEDRAYHVGSFGINGGSSNMIPNAIAGTDDDVLSTSRNISVRPSRPGSIVQMERTKQPCTTPRLAGTPPVSGFSMYPSWASRS